MNSTSRSTMFLSFLICMIVIHTESQNQARAVGLLTGPTYDFTFEGDLTGFEGIPSDTTSTFSIPINIGAQVLPFTAANSQNTGSGDAVASYTIDIASDFVPAFDVLNLQLDLEVTALVRASWANWSNSDADLDGALTSYVSVTEACTAEYALDMAWSYSNAVVLNHNVISIKGPLDASGTEQYGFVFDVTLSSTGNWEVDTSASMADTPALVPGVYKIELSSAVSAYATRNSAGPNPGASTSSIDLQNDVSFAITGTIAPGACPPGIPCAADADRDGSSSLLVNDFALWYNAPADVTSDGQINMADEAAMAYLLGFDMIDTNDNGMVDEVDAWLESVASADQVTASVARLHGAHPNPFNPATTLAFTLPQSGVVSLAIFDVKGKRIKSLLASENRDAGYHEILWNGRNESGRVAAAGVYFYRLDTEQGHHSDRMLLLK